MAGSGCDVGRGAPDHLPVSEPDPDRQPIDFFRCELPLSLGAAAALAEAATLSNDAPLPAGGNPAGGIPADGPLAASAAAASEPAISAAAAFRSSAEASTASRPSDAAPLGAEPPAAAGACVVEALALLLLRDRTLPGPSATEIWLALLCNRPPVDSRQAGIKRQMRKESWRRTWNMQEHRQMSGRVRWQCK